MTLCAPSVNRVNLSLQHCKNKIVRITKLLVSTVARNNLNCNLIGRVGCHGYTVIIIE